MNSKICISVVRGSSGFETIKDDWLSLSNRSALNFYNFPFWYEAKILSESMEFDDVYFACGYISEQLSFVIPLKEVTIKKGSFSFRYLELFYSDEMGACDITSEININQSWDKIVLALRKNIRNFLFIRMQNINENSAAIKYGLLECSEFTKHSHNSNYLEFKNSYDDFISSYKKKVKSDLRRRHRNAESMGELKLQTVTEYKELEGAFQYLLSVEDSGWKGEAGTSIIKQPVVTDYYRLLMKSFGKQGMCQINLLFLDDKCIAASFYLHVHNTIYLLKLGHDESLYSISPGRLLVNEIIKYGIETKQFNKMSFVTGMSWNKIWSPKYEKVYLGYSSCGNLIGKTIISGLKLRERFFKKS